MGNICRSPTAEGCMKKHLEDNQLTKQFLIDSAGTTAYHKGEPADSRSQQQALKHGIDLSKQRARQVTLEDFHQFHQIIAMDQANLSDLKKMQPKGATATLSLLTQWFPESNFVDVPDPYYGKGDGFKTVFDLIEQSTLKLLQNLNPTTKKGSV